MVNFDELSPEQLKKYIKPLKLKKMELSELGKLLGAVRSYNTYYAEQKGIEALIEKTYWVAAEKEIIKEFQRRNCNVFVLSFAQVFAELNKLLVAKDTLAVRQLDKILSAYDSEAMLQIKKELMEDPDYQAKFGEVIAFFDKKIGAALS